MTIIIDNYNQCQYRTARFRIYLYRISFYKTTSRWLYIHQKLLLRMKKISNITFIFILFVCGMFSCKQTAEKQQEKSIENALEQGNGEKAGVDIEEGNITIESEEGKMEIKSGAHQWPSDMPSDVPELNTGKIIGTTTSDAAENRSWSIRYQDVTISALDKYAAILKSRGYKITTMKSGKGGMVSGEKDKLGVIFTVAPEISVVVVSEQKK